MISVGSQPDLVMGAEPVQAFQGLILNGDRVGSLLSYPVNAQRAILIEGKKRCQSGPKMLPGCGKAISAALMEACPTSCSQLGQVHCDHHSSTIKRHENHEL